MTSREIIETGLGIFTECPEMMTKTNFLNLQLAARLKWEQEEMGGLEHVQFAHRNGTPIVPPGHCGHPTDLVKRGFVDGVGWTKKPEPKVNIFKYFEGNHYYVTVDGVDVIENGRVKFNTPKEAEEAAKRYLKGGVK